MSTLNYLKVSARHGGSTRVDNCGKLASRTDAAMDLRGGLAKRLTSSSNWCKKDEHVDKLVADLV